MNVRTCYEILNLSRESTLDEAKEAYKRLVKLWHPDQYGNFPEKQKIAQENLKEINVAYRDIVAILKNSPVETATLPFENVKQYHDEKPENKKRSGTSFWNIVSHYFNTGILRSLRSAGPKKNTRLSSVTPREQDAGSVSGLSGIDPDFQQIFKQAVREKRLMGETRQRHMKRKRTRGQFGNAALYRLRATRRRSPGDRVEKITPVRRVNRIGD